MEALFFEQWQASLRYIDLPGREPAHVYVHGLAGAAAPTFTRVVARGPLVEQRSLLVDLFGFGFSDRPEGFSYTLEDHARTIAGLLDHRKVKGCTIVGYSMGGSIAITLAVLRPDLAARLVLIEPNLDPGGGSGSQPVVSQSEEAFCSTGCQAIIESLREPARAGDRLADAVVAMGGVAAPFAIHRSAVSLVAGTQPTWRENLLAMSIPRAFVFGGKPPVDPDVEELPRHGIPVFVVPDAAHGMMWDNPSGFAEALQAALVA